jgi:hypothetical protein
MGLKLRGSLWCPDSISISTNRRSNKETESSRTCTSRSADAANNQQPFMSPIGIYTASFRPTSQALLA